MTTQPKDLMTLEETIYELIYAKDRNNHSMRTRSALEAALYHLEAGRRDAERLDSVQRNGANVQYCGGCFILTANGGAQFMTRDLRAAIDGAYPSPTQTEEPQG